MSFQVGFTGTRHGMTRAQAKSLAWLLYMGLQQRSFSFHHGDCVGADVQAASIAHAFDGNIVSHPPSDPKLRAYFPLTDLSMDPAPYLVRNRAIVNSSEWLIATPYTYDQAERSGTWSTVRYARDKRAKTRGWPTRITIIWPDGSVLEEPTL
jgi:hypothetical protein